MVKPTREARGALGHQLADLLRRASSMPGGPGQLQQDVAARLARDADRQPAHEAEIDVIADLEPELADVEVERLVLVEHEDAARC